MLKLANKEFLSIGFYINLLSNPKSPVNKNVNTVANLARRKSDETSYSKSAKRSNSLVGRWLQTAVVDNTGKFWRKFAYFLTESMNFTTE